MLVSVFTSCWNQASYLPQAIESVLNQTYKDFEYLLFDDGSTDETWEIMESYRKKDSRIRTFQLPKQPNVGYVQNLSIRESKGDVWVWCPSDDLLLPSCIETKLAFLEEHPGTVIYSDYVGIDGKGRKLGRPHRLPQLSPEKLKAQFDSIQGLPFTGIMIPMEVFQKIGGFPEHLKYSEDFYWLLKALISDIPVRNVGEVLQKKRRHNRSLQVSNIKAILAQVPKLRQQVRKWHLERSEKTNANEK